MFEYLVMWVVVARPIRRSYPCFLCLSIFLLFVYWNDFFCQLSSHICNSWGTRTSSFWQVIDMPAQENWVQEFTMNIGSCVSTWKDIQLRAMHRSLWNIFKTYYQCNCYLPLPMQLPKFQSLYEAIAMYRYSVPTRNVLIAQSPENEFLGETCSCRIINSTN